MDQRKLAQPETGAFARSDQDLVARIRAADIGAFRQLYKHHSAAVFALCVRMTRDRQAAEEAMQDTFWQLWSRPAQYDAERGSVLTFLFQIARSRCLDRLRRERAISSRVSVASAELQPSDDREATPLQLAIASEDKVRVRSALNTLRPEYREAVVLSYFEGLSQKEISTKLSAPLGTVKSRVRRGLLELRHILSEGAVS